MAELFYTSALTPPPFDRREILRYAGMRGEEIEASLKALLDECLEEIAPRLAYRVCYRECVIARTADVLDLGPFKTSSQSLGRALLGCDRAILFAATLGLEVDRLIARYASVSPAKALLLQAIGTERIEALCDCLVSSLAAEGKKLRPRFSPGYGDLPLEVQPKIFSFLECPGRIGLSLNQSLLMSPSKSVTAIIGVEG